MYISCMSETTWIELSTRTFWPLTMSQAKTATLFIPFNFWNLKIYILQLNLNHAEVPRNPFSSKQQFNSWGIFPSEENEENI